MSTRTSIIISEWENMSGNVSSIGQMARKIKKFYKINEEDREMLQNIFTSYEEEDPNWEEDSFFLEIFNSRIQIVEFFGMLVSDHEWSHLANKKQMEKILELFDKVYGYTEGLSRVDEINKRYQK